MSPKPEPKLVVSEVFGPTIQGEGPSIGTPAVFLRLGGCNLQCVWCDTAYTWDWARFDPRQELHSMNIAEVWDELRDRMVKIRAVGNKALLVITGGEPMLQVSSLSQLFTIVREHFPTWQIEIETAGTIGPGTLVDYVDHWNVSPKLSHSGNPYEKRIIPKTLTEFATLSRAGRSCFKFVVQEISDLAEVDELVVNFSMENIFIMPEGTSSQRIHEVERRIIDECIRRGYRIAPRLHVDLFGNRRGV